MARRLASHALTVTTLRAPAPSSASFVQRGRSAPCLTSPPRRVGQESTPQLAPRPVRPAPLAWSVAQAAPHPLAL
jgi:hypothetical protein